MRVHSNSINNGMNSYIIVKKMTHCIALKTVLFKKNEKIAIIFILFRTEELGSFDIYKREL